MNGMDLETQLRSIASGMEYPSTPDIAGSVAGRLRGSPHPRFLNRAVVRSVVFVIVLFLSLMMIPPVRAAVVDFIQIGVVRIFRSEPPPPPQVIPATLIPVTATPISTQQPLLPLLEEMVGEVTLAEAQQMVAYPLLLPAHPADLGQPDRVFVQDTGGPMTILVWLDPQNPAQVWMSLHFIPEGSWAVKKMGPAAVQETQVNAQPAVWAVGPYPLRLQNGDLQISRMVEGHVLIWEKAGMTYRLETSVSMEEAVRIAESLEPIP